MRHTLSDEEVTAVVLMRSKPWDAKELLAGLSRGDIELDDEALAAFTPAIEDAMVTEYDSQNMDALLTAREREGVRFSSTFTQFREAWCTDEWNHYDGYRRLLHMITGRSEDELHEMTVSRKANFDAILPFLEDEFTMCVTFAYDEVVTRFACATAQPTFKSFGNPTFEFFINRVRRDEGFHFSNLVKVLRREHASRLHDTPEILDRLLDWDAKEMPYQSTFVLDHDLQDLNNGQLQRCANTVAMAVAEKPNRS